MQNIILAFLLTLIAGLSTMIGIIFIFYKGNIIKATRYSLAFAAGVMFSVSILDLIPEALRLLTNNLAKIKAFKYITFFIITGFFMSTLIDIIIPENNEVGDKKLYKLGIFSMLVIIIHNIPEGIATFLSSSTDISLGISLTIAIALHNIPEGISISVPIYSATESRGKALKLTLISALAEPLGAIIAFLFLKPIITDNIMGCTLAIVAGIMSHISLVQLLPTSLKCNEKIKTFLIFILGIIFMLLSIHII